MAGYGYVLDALARKASPGISNRMTIGRVVDTNDPQQMGRVRAFCPGFGDQTELTVQQIPWALYVSPLSGVSTFGRRGAEKSPISGPVAYGMWNIPKIGAYVLVGCIDDDPSLRFYAGCIQPQYMTHTMPHGRFIWQQPDPNSTIGRILDGKPDGPLDTHENKIQPLYDNLISHFTITGDKHPSGAPTQPHENLEWRTRGADNQVSAITNLHLQNKNDAPGSKAADHEWGNFEFTTVDEENGERRVIKGPGYGVDQHEPNDKYPATGGTNYDSLIYSWTTPGFHSISMDDRHENARIRIRTTSGHQIIMDDTNERIYISTAGGESWIEIDKVGNIDIYASKDISTHAGGDINFTTDKTFRVQAQEGIHFVSNDKFRVHAFGQLDIRTEDGLNVEAINNVHFRTNSSLFIESVANTDINVGNQLSISSGSDTNINTSGEGFWTTGGEMHHLSGGTMFFTGGTDIHLNGPPAESALPASNAANAQFAYITTRIPEHEPWARIYSDPAQADKDGSANSFQPKPADYTDQNIGKQDRDGNPLTRNERWHR